SSAHAKVAITSLLQILEVAAIDQSTIEQALSLPYRDFEDAVQIMAAVQCKAEYLVTRAIKDFQPAPLSVIQPGELLALI
ncbi:MAG: pilus assembly protein, partial [Chloroflexi bacterium]|nr:pilus assembly protein [Chloroflexota bacterium]